MKQKTVSVILLLVMLSFLTGCWSRRELNDLAIVVGMGIDKSGKQYEVSVQVVDPGEVSKKDGRGGQAPVTVYSSKGDTMAEALRRLTTVSPRNNYFAHLRILVLSEELARQGIGGIVDFFSRYHEFRTDFYISVARQTSAKQILTMMTPTVRIPAEKIFNSLEVAEKEWSPVITVKLDELINDIVIKGKNPVLTGFRIVGDPREGEKKKNVEAIEPAANIQAWGLAAFREDRLVGWLNETESKGYSDITNKLHRSVVEIPCASGGRLAVDVMRSKSDIKGNVRNGNPEATVKIRTEASVSDVQCKIDLTKTETIAHLEKEVEEEMEKHIEASLRKAKTLKTDIFGFGEAVRRANPAYWKTVKEDWHRRFPDLPVEIRIEVHIRRVGTITNSVYSKT
ncbi:MULTISPECIES: Ger(x)C family spore germination protein [unclassified Paenibacillus]|uniref:Ger(x)C family spore germination protein n=1 Tax=unclassified Paenibacillus TaxID=185978 RepID=UPI001C11EA5A|nr:MULTISPECIES: Ger(x)C family spore germination protein [unclassified Paenibacillus]MBU5442917.1 Ger(x)C family spore germination protein [Paenibacillus sp. MSJ-34]CAH0119536.1 Spore germination protein B3 [Paenibacillus sp. CECT 9249]